MTSNGEKKKKILLVDDEKLFIKSVTEGLKPYQSRFNFEVLTALNGKEAIDISNQTEVDAVLTDIRMPEADGFKLISHLINNYPSIPVVVMTAFGSQEIEKKVRELGIVRYLEKPIDFDILLNTIRDLLAIEKKSRIEGITISTFLQMMEMEKITCTLAITSQEKQGILYLSNGELLEAETDSGKGIGAAMEILTWKDVKIDMKDTCPLREGTINKSLTAILLENFKALDEKIKKREEKAEPTPAPAEKKPEKKEEPKITMKDDPMDDTKQFKKNFLHIHLDIPKLHQAIDILKSSLNEALISTDIYSSEDSQSIVAWNSNPAACALFGQITAMLGKSLKELSYPSLGRYYLLYLEGKKVLLVIPLGDYQWIMLIDSSKIQLGMLLNIAIPKAIGILEEALTA